MRLLTLATLYPSESRPTHGIFVENRLKEMLAHGGFTATVVAPVPWFPFKHSRFGAYAAMARTPHDDVRHGIRVLYPRYPVLPKIGMSIAPFLLAAALLPVLRRLLRSGVQFDVIDAHYLYPDGVAAAFVAKLLRKPVVLTARGSDVNLFPRFAIPRRLILWALAKAAAVVTVSAALKQSLIALGVPGERISVLRNGVDLQMFCPGDREKARQRLDCHGITLLSVGNLKAMKGHHLAISALTKLPAAQLIVVGGGEQRKALEELVLQLGVRDRVRFAGVVPQPELRDYYRAADILVLASSMEGWPNVLLEAMACGTPVVATAVGGVPEIVASPAAGVMAAERSADAIAEGVLKLCSARIDRASTRSYVERFGWEPTVSGLREVFGRVVANDSP